VYFPFGLKSIYQAAQNMVIDHFADQCEQIDSRSKELLRDLEGKRVHREVAERCIGQKQQCVVVSQRRKQAFGFATGEGTTSFGKSDHTYCMHLLKQNECVCRRKIMRSG
jgi:hypothetical protein